MRIIAVNSIPKSGSWFPVLTFSNINFFTAASKRRCQHIGNESAANEREVDEAGRVIKVLGAGGLIKFIFSPPHFLFRSAAAVNYMFV